MMNENTILCFSQKLSQNAVINVQYKIGLYH